MEVDSATSGSAAVLGAGVGAAAPQGVARGHWGEANRWAGPGGASDVWSELSPGLAGADGAGTGVDRAMMARTEVGCRPPRERNRDMDMGDRGYKVRSRDEH